MEAVEAANPGILDEVLPSTTAFKLPKAETPRGQKRKEAASCAETVRMEASPMVSVS